MDAFCEKVSHPLDCVKVAEKCYTYIYYIKGKMAQKIF